MAYAEKFLKSKGQDCIIDRPIPVNTKVSIKRSTKSNMNLGIREAFWEGLVLYDAKLQSGEIITIRESKYLIQTVDYDPASLECAFFSAKCNATIQHQRLVKDVDENFNPVEEWKDLNTDVPSYGEIITYRMTQEDPGLLEGTKYTFQVSKVLELKELDRIIYDGKNYEVVSIDDIGMSGIYRIQVSVDLRAD